MEADSEFRCEAEWADTLGVDGSIHGRLQFDDRIAAGVADVGWVGIGITLAWVFWRFWSDHKTGA